MDPSKEPLRVTFLKGMLESLRRLCGICAPKVPLSPASRHLFLGLWGSGLRGLVVQDLRV